MMYPMVFNFIQWDYPELTEGRGGFGGGWEGDYMWTPQRWVGISLKNICTMEAGSTKNA